MKNGAIAETLILLQRFAADAAGQRQMMNPSDLPFQAHFERVLYNLFAAGRLIGTSGANRTSEIPSG